MNPVTLTEICRWTSGQLIKAGMIDRVDQVAIDSRFVARGSLFVPLKGEKQDGHDFLKQAALNGATAALVKRGTSLPPDLPDSMALIEVHDCLEALQQIARGYRSRFDLPVIAITGSYGKTTTKDLVASVLSTRKKVLKNRGNFNNHIGLPLTLLELDSSRECAVLEMGMSGLGEISFLSRMASPDIAMITNIGWAHVEKLGSRDAIAEAKCEIVQGLQKEKIVVINGDDSILDKRISGLVQGKQIKRVGFGGTNDLVGRNVTDLSGRGFTFQTNQTGDFVFHINHPGVHHAISGLFAVWAGLHFGLTYDDIQNGFQLFEPAGMRMEIVTINHCILINDAYNANPDSMEAALRFLGTYPASRRIAVLGNMYELGEYAEQCHRGLAEHWLNAKIDYLITVGELASWAGQEAIRRNVSAERVLMAADIREAADYLKKVARTGDVILLKGSRAMAMENMIKLLEEGEN